MGDKIQPYPPKNQNGGGGKTLRASLRAALCVFHRRHYQKHARPVVAIVPNNNYYNMMQHA